MLPFVDYVAAPALALALAGLYRFRCVLARVPSGNVFLCTARPPRVGMAQRVLPGIGALVALGAALWLGGRAAGAGEVAFAGMSVLLGAQLVWALGAQLAHQLA